MFFRIKSSGERRLYIRMHREHADGARTTERVLATLGASRTCRPTDRLDILLTLRCAPLRDHAAHTSSLRAGTLEAGRPPTGASPSNDLRSSVGDRLVCPKAVEQLAKGRGFGFSLERRAVFASVLHRLSGLRLRIVPARSGWMPVASMSH